MRAVRGCRKIRFPTFMLSRRVQRSLLRAVARTQPVSVARAGWASNYRCAMMSTVPTKVFSDDGSGSTVQALQSFAAAAADNAPAASDAAATAIAEITKGTMDGETSHGFDYGAQWMLSACPLHELGPKGRLPWPPLTRPSSVSWCPDPAVVPCVTGQNSASSLVSCMALACYTRNWVCRGGLPSVWRLLGCEHLSCR